MASPENSRKGLAPGVAKPPLPGRAHRASQAAELLQPEEHPLDGLLHLLRLKETMSWRLASGFQGDKCPSSGKKEKGKRNLRVICPAPARPLPASSERALSPATFPLQHWPPGTIHSVQLSRDAINTNRKPQSYPYPPCCSDEETGAQRGEVTCSRPHS